MRTWAPQCGCVSQLQMGWTGRTVGALCQVVQQISELRFSKRSSLKKQWWRKTMLSWFPPPTRTYFSLFLNYFFLMYFHLFWAIFGKQAQWHARRINSSQSGKGLLWSGKKGGTLITRSLGFSMWELEAWPRNQAFVGELPLSSEGWVVLWGLLPWHQMIPYSVWWNPHLCP